VVLLDGVDRQGEGLGVALGELALEGGGAAQLGGAQGVKSAGWLNNTAHEPFFQSRKEISPSVVMAVKSGAVSPRWRPMGCPFIRWDGEDPWSRSSVYWVSNMRCRLWNIGPVTFQWQLWVFR
jgi:hypothetical protein